MQKKVSFLTGGFTVFTFPLSTTRLQIGFDGLRTRFERSRGDSWKQRTARNRFFSRS